MKKLLPHMFSVSLLCLTTFIAAAESPASWSGIKVNVKADQAVTTEYQLTDQADGFQRLDILLSNKGAHPLTIDMVNITIPLEESLSDQMQMVFGGSCMGRTPMLLQNVGTKSEKTGKKSKPSSSHMYEMIRLADDSYVFVGSLSWRILLPNFTQKDDSLVIWSNGEGKQLKPGETIQYEKIVLKRGKNWLDVLDKFGTAIAAENGITTLKPADYKGWATWDYYGRVFTAKDIFGNMDALNKLAPDANMIQIDGGWWTERGDYTTIRPDLLPGGIKAIVSRIVAEGKTPGLHFDGFRGDAASEICKKHPEYFLHDQDGKLIVETNRKAERVMNYTFFDYSHPGARAHIAECIRTMKEDWGVRYFKVDFMRYGLENDIKVKNKHVTSFKAHDPSLSGVERFRLGMKTIRDAIGPDNYFLGCSAVFGPCIGFVDGMRTGGDIHPHYEAFPERCLANLSNYYLCGKVFNGDADYLVYREAADEDETVSQEDVKHGGSMTMNEAQTWADFNKLFGTCRLNSDNLMTLRPERQALVKEVLDFPAMDETVPLDFWQRATDKSDGFEWILSRAGDKIYLGIFNWGDKPKQYALGHFQKDGRLSLPGRHSKVLPYTGNLKFAELTRLMAADLK